MEVYPFSSFIINLNLQLFLILLREQKDSIMGEFLLFHSRISHYVFKHDFSSCVQEDSCPYLQNHPSTNNLSLTFKKLFIFIASIDAGRRGAPVCASEGQRTMQVNLFSHPTLWVPGNKHRSSSLVDSTLILNEPSQIVILMTFIPIVFPGCFVSIYTFYSSNTHLKPSKQESVSHISF